MSWSQSQISAPSSPNPLPNQLNYQKKSPFGSSISPAIIFVLVLVAILLFVSGLLHLLVSFLLRQRSSASGSNSYPPEINGSDAFRRQLQQLFHLHDSGLDQAVIDALPVFLYKDIMGLKEPFDCAVCLCEFSDKDKLRLLPICSHAFHIDCIDTWLLSNSTCPLCRATLYVPGLENPVFDFEFESTQEDEFTSNSVKPMENDRRISSRRVFSVRLGKFKGNNVGIRAVEGETSSSNLDSRRCFSMGSYQYVVADSDFKVSFCPTRVVNGAKLVKGRGSEGDVEGKKISCRSKGESFSVSKIWQWSKKDRFQPSSETQLGSISSVGVRLP